MRIDIATLFPEMCDTLLKESILGRAQRAGTIQAHCHNIRDFAGNKHNRVDDCPYSGGPGMVMQAEPIARCCEAIAEEIGQRPYIIFMSAAGKPLTQEKCKQLAKMPYLTLVCGHYEGMDERVIEEFADEELSIGDYVITGGELAALVVADSVFRLCDGVLASPEGYEDESHYNGLLEYPQYTRPEEWRGRKVPEVLLSGHRANVEKWRRERSLARTKARRPDLLERWLKAQRDSF